MDQVGSTIYAPTLIGKALVKPGFCPFCVHNADLPAGKAVKPYPEFNRLAVHIKTTHLLPLLEAPPAELACPIPSCQYTCPRAVDIGNRMVTAHGLAIGIKIAKCASIRRHHALLCFALSLIVIPNAPCSPLLSMNNQPQTSAFALRNRFALIANLILQVAGLCLCFCPVPPSGLDMDRCSFHYYVIWLVE